MVEVECLYNNITSFNGSSCANKGKDALNTPETLSVYIIRVILSLIFILFTKYFSFGMLTQPWFGARIGSAAR